MHSLPSLGPNLNILAPNVLSPNLVFENLEIGDETTEMVGVVVKIFPVVIKKLQGSKVYFKQ